MVNDNDIIRLNGKPYDARTGRLLVNDIIPSSGGHKPASSHKTLHTATSLHIKTMPTQVKYRVASSKPATSSSQVDELSLAKLRHINHLKAHEPEKAQTLARQAVHKPGPSNPKANIRVNTPVTSAFSLKKTSFKPKPVDSARLDRAKATAPSHLVHHFNLNHKTEPIRPTLTKLPVNKPKPVGSVPASAAARADVVYHKPSQPMFDRALASANSHEQPAVKPKARRHTGRNLTILAILVVILAGSGWLTIVKMPDINIELASLHADFSAKLPGFTPSGFAPSNHMQSSYDNVSITYDSTPPGQSYTIAEQVSNWDNQTLQEYINSTGEDMQSWQNLGNTFYGYGNHFSWVSGGIWYQITNNASLSNQQLLKIASSF